MRELNTIDEFREALKHEESIVITDTTGKRFHLYPKSCGHVLEEYFVTKVIENAGRNGRYFAVSNRGEAEERWPGVADCWV